MWNAEVLDVDAQDDNRIWVRAPRRSRTASTKSSALR